MTVRGRAPASTLMNPRPRTWLAVLAVMSLVACDEAPQDLALMNRSATSIARESRLELAKAERTMAIGHDAPLAQWRLPLTLQEISGLALTSDGRLLAHGDEMAHLFQVDYRRGILVKQFSLGKSPVKGDFEGITVAHDLVYLLTSKGMLYSFREGAEGAQVTYQKIDTGLEKECEFEGVTFDATIDALLLSCKIVRNKAFVGSLMVFRWKLSGDSTARLSRIALPLTQVIGNNGWKDLRPSDITVDPFTGNYILLASAEKALIGITPAGALVFAHPLPPGHHQPEGIAITKDSILIVSDEGGTQPAIITLYRWP